MTKWPARALSFVSFVFYYLTELVLANLRIATDVLRPTMRLSPGFLAIPLKAQTPTEILVFANLVSMSPGTMSVEVSPDRNFLYVHALYVNDPVKAKQEVGDQLQDKVLSWMR